MDNTLDIFDVRKTMAEVADREVGHLTGVVAEYGREKLSIHTDEKNSWMHTEVSVNLNTDIAGNRVRSYYINYASRWSSREQAEQLSVLLGVAATVARALEAQGLAYND